MHFLCTQWHLWPRLWNRGLLLVEMALSEVSLARKNKNKREQNACHKKQHVGPLLLVPPPCPSAAFCKSSTASCRDRGGKEKKHTTMVTFKRTKYLQEWWSNSEPDASLKTKQRAWAGRIWERRPFKSQQLYTSLNWTSTGRNPIVVTSQLAF